MQEIVDAKIHGWTGDFALHARGTDYRPEAKHLI